MLKTQYRRIYASVKESMETAIGEALLKNKKVFAAAELSKEDIKETLDEAIGDAVEDVAKVVAEELDELTEEVAPKETEELPMEVEELKPEEGQDEEVKEPSTDEDTILSEVADELEEIKAKMMLQSAHLKKAGKIELAAKLRAQAKKL